MSDDFRSRRFTAVPPHQRPRRSRRAARVIVTDGDSVLMFADTDPGLPGSRWWVTPGGGIDSGETPLEAAVREVAEETGLRVPPEVLAGPIMTRVVIHGYSDQILSQHETFYVLHTERFPIDTTGHTASEQLTLDGFAWIALKDVDGWAEPIWPEGLPDLVLLCPASRGVAAATSASSRSPPSRLAVRAYRLDGPAQPRCRRRRRAGDRRTLRGQP